MRQHSEVIVVDGDACKGVEKLCTAFGVRYFASQRGRGQQLRVGVDAASQDWIWMLHADSEVPLQTQQSMVRFIEEAETPCWGRFKIGISELGVVAWFMNKRSMLTKICTGDQGIFAHRTLIEGIDGFPDQSLMEDIEFSKRLKRRYSRTFVCVDAYIYADPRRWRNRGVIRTVLSMWRYRLRYFFGADPERLYLEYYGHV